MTRPAAVPAAAAVGVGQQNIAEDLFAGLLLTDKAQTAACGTAAAAAAAPPADSHESPTSTGAELLLQQPDQDERLAAVRPSSPIDATTADVTATDAPAGHGPSNVTAAAALADSAAAAAGAAAGAAVVAAADSENSDDMLGDMLHDLAEVLEEDEAAAVAEEEETAFPGVPQTAAGAIAGGVSPGSSPFPALPSAQRSSTHQEPPTAAVQLPGHHHQPPHELTLQQAWHYEEMLYQGVLEPGEAQQQAQQQQQQQPPLQPQVPSRRQLAPLTRLTELLADATDDWNPSGRPDASGEPTGAA
jgi:hypothetical protein